MLITLISLIFLLLRNRSAALKHFCLLMGMVSLLILPVSAFVIPDITWEFPFSNLLFELMPFAWQEYLLKTSYTPINPFWWQLILVVYLLVSTSIIFYLMIGFIQLWKIYARAKPVRDNDTLELVNEIRHLFSINRKIIVVSSREIESPCVWGMISPRILLPDTYRNWTYEQKVSVLMHELGHIHRYDALSLFVVKISCAIFWFLIPVWWFSKKMARDSEMACDDLIYRLRDKQVQYAEHLLQLANHSHNHSGVVVSMSGSGSEATLSGRSEIYQRIMAVLDNKKPRQPVHAESVQYPLIIGLLLVASLGALSNINASSVARNYHSTSVFNWSWGKIVESGMQDSDLLEAEKTLAFVDEFEAQEKPVLITRIIPVMERADYPITAEYKANSEIDKATLAQDFIDQQAQSLKINSDYKILHSIQPIYPDAALKKGITGFVKIVFDIDNNGMPINMRITESQPDAVFDQSVIQALEQSRFEWLEKNSPHASIQQHFVFQLDTRRKR